MEGPVRILALDGGGIWALIQAKALGAIYGMETPGRDILRRFRFAFANSGGAIVLAGLIANMTPAEILQFFTSSDQAGRMFDRKRLFWLRRMVPFLPRYRTRSKRHVLRDVFGTRMLETLDAETATPTYMVIVGFDYDRERAFFFRSLPSLRTNGARVRLADAVHASSTAPIRFFDLPAEIDVSVAPSTEFKTMHFWDGAVTGLNNPVAAAVAEAIAVGCDAGAIRVLSIGTGNVVLPNTRTQQTVDTAYVIQPAKSGLLATLSKLAQSIVGDPPDFASFLAHTSLGGGTPANDDAPPLTDGRVVRLNPLVTPVWETGLPQWNHPPCLDPDAFKRLIALEIDATGWRDIALIGRFADLWLAGNILNQPIRLHFRDPNRGLVAEIGHTDARLAMAKWQQFDPAASNPPPPEPTNPPSGGQDRDDIAV